MSHGGRELCVVFLAAPRPSWQCPGVACEDSFSKGLLAFQASLCLSRIYQVVDPRVCQHKECSEHSAQCLPLKVVIISSIL